MMNYEWFYIVARFGIWGFSRLFVGWVRLIIRLPLPPLRGGLRAVIGFGIWGFSRLFCRMDAAYHQTPPTPS
jgi:hypothetical protein